MDAREEQLACWTCCRLTRTPLGGKDGKDAVVRCVGARVSVFRGHRAMTGA
jgi:hypothetical protein